MMQFNSVRTIYSQALALAVLLGKDYECIDNTTMNEKFDILKERRVPSTVYPTLKYFSIGNGGADVVFDALKNSAHSPVSAALYNEVPFVIRDINNDITDSEKTKYRFRKVTNINGTDYIEYYLKAIDVVKLDNIFFDVQIENNVPVLDILETDNNNILFPVPKTEGEVVTDDKTSFVAKSSQVMFTLTLSEIAELKEVFRIKYNEENPTINELALCTGIDTTMEDGSKEAYAVQAAFFAPLSYDLSTMLLEGSMVNKIIEIGGSEPLIK